MLLHENLTWVHSQKDPGLHFDERFALSKTNNKKLIILIDDDFNAGWEIIKRIVQHSRNYAYSLSRWEFCWFMVIMLSLTPSQYDSSQIFTFWYQSGRRKQHFWKSICQNWIFYIFFIIIRMIVCVSVAVTWMSCLRWQLDSGDDMISQDPSCQGTHRLTGSTGSSWRDVGVTTSKRSALKDKKLRKRWEQLLPASSVRELRAFHLSNDFSENLIYRLALLVAEHTLLLLI